ncbi:MAG: hypothetical protein H6609_19700 [Ignavibacteriales bacterium]|nr:hypothetical protein [Ignavibacteriales bacterium]
MAIQIISLLIALLAVIVGPIITYRITKKNLEFQFRSLTQENWITKLEESILSFLTHTEQWIGKYQYLVESGLADHTKIDPNNQQIDELLDAINSAIIKLQLHLEEAKPDQKEMMLNVAEIKEIINTRVYDEQSVQKLKNLHYNIIEKAKLLFKEERQKIAGIFR